MVNFFFEEEEEDQEWNQSYSHFSLFIFVSLDDNK